MGVRRQPCPTLANKELPGSAEPDEGPNPLLRLATEVLHWAQRSVGDVNDEPLLYQRAFNRARWQLTWPILHPLFIGVEVRYIVQRSLQGAGNVCGVLVGDPLMVAAEVAAVPLVRIWGQLLDQLAVLIAPLARLSPLRLPAVLVRQLKYLAPRRVTEALNAACSGQVHTHRYCS